MDGRMEGGPGGIPMWAVRPEHDFRKASLYKELLEYVRSYTDRIPQAARFLHWEKLGISSSSIAKQNKDKDKDKDTIPLHAFPGAIPHSLMRSEIDIFYNGRRSYVFLYKGDGQRLLLVFATIRGRPIAYFITRRCQIYLLPPIPNLPSNLFDGTVLDLELVQTTPSTEGGGRLEVFDVVALAGTLAGHYHYVRRMHSLYEFCAAWSAMGGQGSSAGSTIGGQDGYSPTRPNEGFPVLATTMHHDDDYEKYDDYTYESFPIVVPTPRDAKQGAKKEDDVIRLGDFFLLVPKRFYTLWQLDTLIFDVIPKMPEYASEGLIAMPVEDPVMIHGTCGIKKIKRPQYNTLDLLVGYSHGQFHYWVELPEREEAHLRKGDTPLKLEPFLDTHVVLFSMAAGATFNSTIVLEGQTYQWMDLKGKVVECRAQTTCRALPDAVQSGWWPMRLRPDKRKPNTLQTALRTVENIDLDYDEIFPFLRDRANKKSAALSRR